MCYSQEGSIVSFSISLCGFIYLYNRNQKNDRMIGLILLSISLMQISEFMIHSDRSCKSGWNKFGSQTGFANLYIIQPLLSLLAVVIFSNMNQYYIPLWFLIWISSFIFTSFHLPTEKEWCSKCDSNGNLCNLNWPWYKGGWITSIFYMLLVFVIPILMSDLGNKWFWMIYVFIGPLISILLHPDIAGSIWCFVGPLLTLLIVIFDIPNKIDF